MISYYPYILGIIDTLNDWNEKLNGFAATYLDNAGVGTAVVIGIFIISAWVISALNKK